MKGGWLDHTPADGSNQRFGGFEANDFEFEAAVLRKPDFVSVCCIGGYQQIVKNRLVLLSQPYRCDQAGGQAAATDCPSLRLVLFLPGDPPSNSKMDVRFPVHAQAIGRVTWINVAADHFDFGGDLPRELSQLVGPRLPGINVVVVMS